MTWANFFDELFSHDPIPKKLAGKDVATPGKVMICFVNRYLHGIDGIKFKIKYDGKEVSGITTEEKYSFEIQPKTTAPIKISVFSIKSKGFKDLDDVTPVIGKAQLVRKILATAKVRARTEKYEENKNPVPRPKLPPQPTPAGPSPQKKQGVEVIPVKNEQGAPLTQIERPVPGNITVAQLRNIFTSKKLATDDYLKQVADEVNKDLVKFKLDTPLRRAHFFSQIKGETGLSMKPVREGWQYSATALKSFSKYYRTHPAEAITDAYEKNDKNRIIRPADEVAIGTKHFGKLNGNRADHPKDGSDFRGRGMLQITGYEKYSKFMSEYNKYWNETPPDCVTDPELIVKFPYSVQSAIWFWIKYNIYSYADAGSQESNVAKVTLHVNGGDMGLQDRKDAFVVAYKAFK